MTWNPHNISAPRSGHCANHSQLSYPVKTQYYISFDDRGQIINFGQKPKQLLSKRRVWARDMKRLKSYKNKSSIFDEAQRYQEFLSRKEVNTKAEIAEIFCVSRARVTQYLILPTETAGNHHLKYHKSNIIIVNFFLIIFTISLISNV